MSVETAKRNDKRIKAGLCAVGVLTLLALAAAALRENVFTQWRLIRSNHGDLLASMADGERGRAILDQYEASRIEQNYVPALDAADRCVTCHPGIEDPRMAGRPQPHRVHPGDYLEHHPPARFGCTICHRGQGRALEFEEAKAEDRHWDYPLLPPGLTQSACGLCHSADEVKDHGGGLYAMGKELFEAKGCRSCHNLYGLGGSMGPALDSVGLKIKQNLPMARVEGPHTLPQWLIEHFEDPQKIVAGSQMPPPGLGREEIAALAVYMLSLQERDLPRSYLSPGKLLELYRRSNPEPSTGGELYERLCSSCHDTGEYARYDTFFKTFVPAVRGDSLARTASREFLAETVRLGRPGTLMPAWGETAGGLSGDEIGLVVDYLLENREAAVAASSVPPERLWDSGADIRGVRERGAAKFEKHCSACHLGGLAPDLFNPVFRRTASRGFVFATILAGRVNTPMPAFFAPGGGGMGPGDIADLTEYILGASDTPEGVSMADR